LFSQKKETKEKATPLPLVSFGLSAASGRLRNSLRSNSPRRFPSAAQAEGAAKGIESQNHANVVQNRCSERRMDIGFQSIYFKFFKVI
jgi:hypothetical protein